GKRLQASDVVARGVLAPPPSNFIRELEVDPTPPTRTVLPGESRVVPDDGNAMTRPRASDSDVQITSEASFPTARSLAAGQPFGSRYHIIRRLGIGGMGAVYQAWDADLGVAVALKVI